MSELSILVIAEHNNQVLAVDTLRTLQAAKTIGGKVSVLVMGAACAAVAEAAKACAGVSHVLLAESPANEHRLAENGAALVAEIARNYSHVLASATTFGKNLLPRVAALLDVGQLSDVMTIESPDTVVRPIYAGNALAKVKSLDAIKVMTIRSSAFDAVASTGGNAEVKTVDHAIESLTSQFVSQQTVESARPELPVARVVISGGRGLGVKKTSHWWNSLPTNSAARLARHVRRSMPVSSPTICKSVRPVKSWHQNFILRWGFPARFNTWRV